MFITLELLEKLDASDMDIDWFEEYYPNGVELKQLIQHKFISDQFLHWLYDNINHTTEEIELYHKVLGNSNNDRIYHCSYTTRSKCISDSQTVSSSQQVFRSIDVSDSNVVVCGDTIENSNQIFLSSFVYNSQKVYNSNNVSNCENIVDSIYTFNSRSVYFGRSITNSSEIKYCSNLDDCYFCSDCKNLKHCIGCQGLEDCEYYIFNKPIAPDQFEAIKHQYITIMDCLFNYTDKWPVELYSMETPNIHRNFRLHYQTIPSKFWKWVRTLPNYSDTHMFYLTSLPEFLTK